MNALILVASLASGALMSAPKTLDDATAISIGRFIITSSIKQLNAFPYPETRKEVVLSWESRDQTLTYTLTDDGERLQSRYTIGIQPRQCSFTAHPLQFRGRQSKYYDYKAFFTRDIAAACLRRSTAEIRILQGEARGLTREFPAAYSKFRERSEALHGPSKRRCVKYGFTNHGLYCQRYKEPRN